MKRRAVLLCFLSAVLMLMQGCHKPAPNPPAMPDTALTFFSFSESSSYFKRVQGYEYRLEEGNSAAHFFMANEEAAYPVPVDQAWVDTLTGFIRQYDMMAWDGFSGSATGLLDGRNSMRRLPLPTAPPSTPAVTVASRTTTAMPPMPSMHISCSCSRRICATGNSARCKRSARSILYWRKQQ